MPTDCELLIPKNSAPEPVLTELTQLAPLPAYNRATLAFCKALSVRFMSRENKDLPEVIALGFWLRSIPQTVPAAELNQQAHITKALGLVVHFTPRNVDTMFIYSWICGLLLGNKNIVRVAAQRNNAVQQCILHAISALYTEAEYRELARRNVFLTAQTDSHWPATLSSMANARVIWGGDDSVQAIKSLPSKPRVRDVSFTDRYSAAVLNFSERVTTDVLNHWAQRLWSDTQPHEQQACSSPKLIFWLGSTEQQASFFTAVDELAQQQLQHSKTLRNEQLVFSQYAAALCESDTWQGQFIQVVSGESIQQMLPAHTGQMTYLVVNISDLAAIAELQSAKLQTLTYAGCDQQALVDLLHNPALDGIDRLVPVGQALEFATSWDGMDLLSMLSRQITLG